MGDSDLARAIFEAGFLAGKAGESEARNPYPRTQAVQWSTWRSGWERGRYARDRQLETPRAD